MKLVGASNESHVDAHASAEVASPVQFATFAESCSQAVRGAGQVSTVVKFAQPVGASGENLVDAKAGAEVASPVQPASTAESCAQAVGAASQVSLGSAPDESPVDARQMN